MILRIFIFFIGLIFFQSCYLYRGLRWGKPDVLDAKRLPKMAIDNNSVVDTLALLEDSIVAKTANNLLLDSVFNRSTYALLVLKNGQLVYEQYASNFSKKSVFNVFSVSKSVIGMLVGNAVAAGKLDVQTSIVHFFPKLLQKDSAYAKVKIFHLLDMQSGIGLPNNLSYLKMGKIYYGKNQSKFFKEIIIKRKPGEKFEYENMNTQLLGWILEKVWELPLNEIVSEQIWKPMRAEMAASWAMDDYRHRNFKAYCGLNTSARDLGKFAWVVMNYGQYQDKFILDSTWIANTVNQDSMIKLKYKNQIWSWENHCTNSLRNPNCLCKSDCLDTGIYVNKYYMKQRRGAYSFQGLYHQFVLFNPQTKTIVIRLGEMTDYDIYRKLDALLW